jgi:Family of unknown function (DUF5678)
MNEKEAIHPAESLDRYEGKWVAVRGGRVVAHASNERQLRLHPAVRKDDLKYPVGEPHTGFYMLGV